MQLEFTFVKEEVYNFRRETIAGLHPFLRGRRAGRPWTHSSIEQRCADPAFWKSIQPGDILIQTGQGVAPNPGGSSYPIIGKALHVEPSGNGAMVDVLIDGNI